MWRSRSGSNTRAHFCTCLLSGEVPSPTWVLLRIWRWKEVSIPTAMLPPRFSRPVSAPADIIQHIWRSVKESNLLRLFSPATAFQADPLPFRQRCMFMAPNGGADPHGFSATHSFRNWNRSRPVSFGIWPRSKGSNLSPLGQSQMCCLYTRSVWCERRATIPHASLSTRV